MKYCISLFTLYLFTSLAIFPMKGTQVNEVEFVTTIVEQDNQKSKISLPEGCPLNYTICAKFPPDNIPYTWEYLEKNIQLEWKDNRKYEILLLNLQHVGEKLSPIHNLANLIKGESLTIKKYSDLHYVALPAHFKKLVVPSWLFKKKKVFIVLEQEINSKWGMEVPTFCLRVIKDESEQSPGDQTTPSNPAKVAKTEINQLPIYQRKPKLLAFLGFLGGTAFMGFTYLLFSLFSKKKK